MLLEAIKKHPDKTIELYQTTCDTVEIKAFQHEIASFSFAGTYGISCRSVKGKKMGMAFTEKKDPVALEKIINDSSINASYLTDDPGNAIYENAEKLYSEQFYNPQLKELSLDRKKQFILEMEALAYEFDKRIVNVPDVFYHESCIEVKIANSFGLYKESKTNFAICYIYIIVSDGENTEVGAWGEFKRDFNQFSPDKIIRKAASAALALLNSSPVTSGNYAVILSSEAASGLLGAFLAAPESPIYGENIQKKLSKLEGKTGTQIASPKFSLIDDPVNGWFNSQVFDDEGVPIQKLYVVRDGIFEKALYNIYSAKREYKQSTGHGFRDSYTCRIQTAPTNLYLEPGNINEDQLLKQLASGIFIERLNDLSSGLNPITGDFSLAAKGFLVKNGAKEAALQNFIVAGNFYDLIKRLVDKADNLRNDSVSQFSSPSILIESLAISGE